MKYSKLFGKTARTAKRDMTAVSHKLLYRGGFIRELSAGRYEFLPLGFRVWRKIVDIIDKEMESIGSQRFSIPILQPLEFWKKSARDQAWGKDLMKIKDRSGTEFALSATGEGVVTEMVSETKPSYKELPVSIHQFIIKLRDEKRARGGLLRTREFVMKDAYSFDTNEENMLKTYQSFYDAYSRLCETFGFEYYPCIADSGALGGDYCHEFQIVCDAGEDHIVKCDKCDYAANVEMAEFERTEVNKDEEQKKLEYVKQPWERARAIEDMVKFFKKPKNNMIKSVMYKDKKGKYVIGIVTGDLEVNDLKLAKAAGVDELEKAEEKDLKSIGAVAGALHAWGYEKYKDKITFVADESIVKAKNLSGGFKTKEKDPINVNYGRDFTADIVADIAEPYDGAECKHCKGGKLKLIQTLEFGHVFKYDHFYSKHHDGYFIDKDGKKKLMYMGAYGIGIGRAMAAIVETHHDNKGILWPMNVAPFHVHLITLDEDEDILKKANDIYTQLVENKVEVLWDERDGLTAGEKFNDADLIGIPIRLVISKRSLSKDGVELKLRKDKNETIVELNKIIDVVKNKIQELTQD